MSSLTQRAFYRRSCATKIRHDTEDSAAAHATRINGKARAAAKLRRPYSCGFCEGWHVGRQPDRPTPHPLPPTDLTMLEVLGQRAYYCGELESVGSASSRMSAIRQRARSAIRRGLQFGVTLPSHNSGRSEAARRRQ